MGDRPPSPKPFRLEQYYLSTN